jgi:5-methylthioadenosine/S-adenosylhomocysteine deaminase
MCALCRSFGVNRRRLLAAVAIGGPALFARPQLVSAQVEAVGRPPGGLPPRGEYLVRGGYVLTMDPDLGDLPRADIHVRNGEIVAVGPDLNADAAEVIDASQMIVMPGLIDTHWHMWGTIARNMAGDTKDTGYFPESRVLGGVFKPEDNACGVRLALAEAVNSGITTVHNWSHNLLTPAYADAELQAHKDVSGRALFSYGYSRNTGQNQTLPLDDVARVQKQWLPDLDGLVTLGIASRGPENNTIEICKKEWETARKLGARITIHIGTSEEVFKTRQGVRKLADAGLLGPDLLLVHNTNTDRSDLETIARTQTFLSVSPFTELRTGFGITPILDILSAGIHVSLSVDTMLLCGNCDMFAVMKALQNIGNGSKPSEFALPPRRVLEIATIGGARALGIADKVGSLKRGKRADLMLVRTRDLNMAPLTEPVHMIVQSAQPANVDTVMIDGRILKRDGRLTAVDATKVVDEASAAIQRVRLRVAKENRGAGDVREQLPTL